MVSSVKTATIIGIDSYLTEIEVDLVNSLPGVTIVGLPDTAVSEAKERVRSAIKNSGFMFPYKKVVINLAPADLKKEGTNFDLGIAMGILAQIGEVNGETLLDYAFLGELSLDGTLREINGILPIVCGMEEFGIKNVIVPLKNANEAALAGNVKVYGAQKLIDVVNHFSFENAVSLQSFEKNIENYLIEAEGAFDYDFKDVKGQKKAKRALEIAAAGSHNILMSGSPGSGKTLLAKSFASILPPLHISEALELTKIYSVAGLLEHNCPLINRRPFRSPHHSASAVGIIGGGSNPKPGEITLAHRGVLFLDEVVEFPRSVLEVLRQPIEDNEVVISRANISVKYPANFMLVAAMNPCPCGFFGDNRKTCTCSEFQIQKYRSRLSGPLLDRIDLQIEVSRLSDDELLNRDDTAESSEVIKKRVVDARKIQLERYKDTPILYNGELTPDLVKIFCKLDESSEILLKSAITKFGLSGRAYDRVLKLARTIADLEKSLNIEASHIAEALQYRGFINNIGN